MALGGVVVDVGGVVVVGGGLAADVGGVVVVGGVTGGAGLVVVVADAELVALDGLPDCKDITGWPVAWPEGFWTGLVTTAGCGAGSIRVSSKVSSG